MERKSSSSPPLPPQSQTTSREEISDSSQTEEEWRENPSTKRKTEKLLRLDTEKVCTTLFQPSSPSSSSFVQTLPMFVDGCYVQTTAESESSAWTTFSVAEAGNLLKESTTRVRNEKRETTNSRKRKRPRSRKKKEKGTEVQYNESRRNPSWNQRTKRFHPIPKDERIKKVPPTLNRLHCQPEGSSPTEYYHPRTSLNSWSMLSEALQSPYVSTTCNRQLNHHQNTAENITSESFASSAGRPVDINSCCTNLQNKFTPRLAVKIYRNGEMATKLRSRLSSDLKRNNSRLQKWKENHRNVEDTDDHQATFCDVGGQIDDGENELSSNLPQQRKTSAIWPMERGEMSSGKSSLGFDAANQRKSNQKTTTSHVTGWKRLRRRMKKEEEDPCVIGRVTSGTDCFQAIGPNDPLIFKRPSPVDLTLKVSCFSGRTVDDSNPVLSTANHCGPVHTTAIDDVRDGKMTWGSVRDKWRKGFRRVSTDGVFLCHRNVDLLETIHWTGNRETLIGRSMRGNRDESVQRFPLLLTVATDWPWILPSSLNPQTDTVSTLIQLTLPPPPSPPSSSSSPPPLAKPPVAVTTDTWAFNQRRSQEEAILSSRPLILSPPYIADCPSKHPSVSSSLWRLPVLGRSLRAATAEQRKQATIQLQTLCTTTIGVPRPPVAPAALHCSTKPIADRSLFTGHLRHTIQFPPDAGLVGCLPPAGAPSYEFITSSSSRRQSIHPCHLGLPSCFGFYRRTEVSAYDRLVSQPYLMVVPLPVTFCMLTG